MSKEFSGIEVIRRENTKKLIADTGLTRQEFADKAGINYGLLGHYIGKNPSFNPRARDGRETAK